MGSTRGSGYAFRLFAGLTVLFGATTCQQYNRAESLNQKLRLCAAERSVAEADAKQERLENEGLRIRFSALAEERTALAEGRPFHPSETFAWHNLPKAVYHNHPLCPVGGMNSKGDWLPGQDNKPLCDEFRRLSGE
jgi:hypothetical protein